MTHYSNTYYRAALCDLIRCARLTITEAQRDYSLARLPWKPRTSRFYLGRARERLDEARRVAQ